MKNGPIEIAYNFCPKDLFVESIFHISAEKMARSFD
jgi:hypothetical protein